MLRMIIQVEAPNDDEKVPGVYKTFDVMNTDMEKFLASAGIKGILGYEIRDNPPVPVVKKEEPAPKPDPDAPPKPTGNPIQDKIAEMRHRQALRLQTEGKLPAAKPGETLLERLARWSEEQKKKEEAEKKDKEEKAAKERKEARRKAMEEFNALPWYKRVGRVAPNGATA